ncbi:MAG: hypothetical protein AVDCRST_MAG80-2419, partial [uncultured Rubrobacteraceae bacterium]
DRLRRGAAQGYLVPRPRRGRYPRGSRTTPQERRARRAPRRRPAPPQSQEGKEV